MFQEVYAFSRKSAVRLEENQEVKLPTHLKVESSTNPWEGYTSSYEEEQAGYFIEPKPIDANWSRVDALSGYGLDGEPLIAFDRKKRRVHLSSSHFASRFDRPDATRLRSSDPLQCGRLNPASPLLRQPGSLIRFLLKSHLIRTYAHLESSLELVREDLQSDGRFVSRWRGEHIYFTNERNSSSFQLQVTVDTRSGQVEVSGF